MPSANILLVEDDPSIAFMYEQKLKSSGYDIRVKPDGLQAWEELTSGPMPDLLLLDVVLPKKDGFEILRDIRKHEKLHHLPVILLTNLAQEVDRKQGKKLEATDYIVKAHITPAQLVEIIEKHLTELPKKPAV